VGDAQSGHEKTLTGLLPALAGANLIYGLGMLESGVTFDFGQLVMDNEFARMIKHVVNGIRVDDETLMVDEIHGVGAFGDFLSLDSTLRHMREQSQPKLIDRRVREDWRNAGATDMQQRATAEAVRILNEHTPAPLPAEVAAKLRTIVTDAERELGVAQRS
jgi:trimethylamine--corrinoid protein Co-methyltransferase